MSQRISTDNQSAHITQAAHHGQSPDHETAILFIISGATMLALIAFTAPLTTLEQTAQALHAGVGGKAWLLSAMPLGAASGLLAAGSLGDHYGRRVVFLWGLALLALASVFAATVTSSVLFILARIAQGLGGAAIFSCGLGLLGQTFPEGRARTKATAIWAAALGAGVATGPILSALAAAVGSWTYAYWGAGLLALALLCGGHLILPNEEKRPQKPIDWLGATLFITSLVLLLSGLTEARLGWARPAVIALFGGALFLLAAFVLVESRHRAPMRERNVQEVLMFRIAVFAFVLTSGLTLACYGQGHNKDNDAAGGVMDGQPQEPQERGTDDQISEQPPEQQSKDASQASQTILQVKFSVNGKQVVLKLHDNPTSRDFLSLLPLKVKLSDYAATEKIAHMPRKLSTTGAPAGFDPSKGDVTYYAPWGNLAIFYKDFGYSKGLISMGTISSGLSDLAALTKDQVITFEKVTLSHP